MANGPIVAPRPAPGSIGGRGKKREKRKVSKMLLSALLGGLVAAAVFQPTATRFFAAVVFVSVAWAHELLFAHLDGFAYYGSAAAADLAIILAISLLAHPPRVVLTLARICLVSIVVNLFGWLLWRAYLPPEPYNAAMIGVFIWALLILISRDRQDDNGGAVTMDRWFARLRGYSYPGVKLLSKDGA